MHQRSCCLLFLDHIPPKQVPFLDHHPPNASPDKVGFGHSKPSVGPEPHQTKYRSWGYIKSSIGYGLLQNKCRSCITSRFKYRSLGALPTKYGSYRATLKQVKVLGHMKPCISLHVLRLHGHVFFNGVRQCWQWTNLKDRDMRSGHCK